MKAMPDKWHKAEEKPTHRDPADSAIDRIRASLSELGRTVWANRHHHITIGRAGHDEVRAARAAAGASRASRRKRHARRRALGEPRQLQTEPAHGRPAGLIRTSKSAPNRLDLASVSPTMR